VTLYRVLEISGDSVKESTDEALVTPPPAGTIRWIDVVGQDDRCANLLDVRFHFHPLTLEDLKHFDQRPKLEEYSGYLFIVMHGFRPSDREGADKTEVEPVELHAFLGNGYLVTAHAEELTPLVSVWKRLLHDPAAARRGADFIYYLIVDAIVDANFHLLDDLSDALDDIEDGVLNRAERRDLAHIFRLKKALVVLRRILSPQRDVFAMLAKRGHELVKDQTSLYFRDVYDHLTRIYESIDTARDLLGNALDAYLSMVAQRTNEIMKRLTILSAVFLPLTFLTGFFGQNFQGMPFGDNALMWAAFGVMVALPPGMLILFKRSGWL
jgi:magnesium transporter